MDMTCNIDSKGRLIRGSIGLVFIAAALALVFILPATGWRRLLVLILALGGIFSLFEALRGWCAFRALGMKTRF
jgi:hypothetical protein